MLSTADMRTVVDMHSVLKWHIATVGLEVARYASQLVRSVCEVAFGTIRTLSPVDNRLAHIGLVI